MKHEKRYTVEYASGATGYGWTEDTDRLDEVEDFVRNASYSAYVAIWDNRFHDFIYRKRCLDFTPEIDMLSCVDRDFRTTTRKKKVSDAVVKWLFA